MDAEIGMSIAAKETLVALDVFLPDRLRLLKMLDPACPSDYDILERGCQILPPEEDGLALLHAAHWCEYGRLLATALTVDLTRRDPAFCLVTDGLPAVGRSTRCQSTAIGLAVYLSLEAGWLKASIIVAGQRHSDTGHFYPVAS